MSSTSTLPRINPSKSVLLTPEPLTPSSFAPFGTAIVPPLPQHLRAHPTTRVASPLYPAHQPPIVSANQNTALKTSPISPLTNNYPRATTTSSSSSSRDGQQEKAEAKGLMSIFSCFPRRNTYVDEKTGKMRLRLEILERHPFTTQTFCPFNFSSLSLSSSTPSTSSSTTKPKSRGQSQQRTTEARQSRNEGEGEGGQGKTYFLVIVAPTIQDPTATPPNPPDLSRLRAFLCPVTPDGGLGVAVTYGPGTWHAPMVVLGDRRVDFLVSQFANGVARDDCQEVLVGMDHQAENGAGTGTGIGIGTGAGAGVVEVDLKGLGLGPGSEVEYQGLWRAKL